MSSIYKENRNMLNKFIKSLENCLSGRLDDLWLRREFYPVDSDISNFRVMIYYKMNFSKDIKLVEDSKRLYFCLEFDEISGVRSVGDGYSTSRHTDVEEGTFIIIRRYVDGSRYYCSSVQADTIKSLKNHLVSKGCTIFRGRDIKDMDDAEDIASAIGSQGIDMCANELKDFPIYVSLKNFIKTALNDNTQFHRREKVFPKVKDLSLMPICYFSSDDYVIGSPERRQNSSNNDSTNFYGKFSIDKGMNGKIKGATNHDPYRNDIDFDRIAMYALSYTPFATWIRVEPKTLDYDKKKYSWNYK